MAYTKADLLKLDGAEVVGGNIVHGGLGNRVFVGKISEEGVFFITPEGEERLRALEKAPAKTAEAVEETPVKPKATRKKAAVVEDDIASAISQVE